MKKYFYIGLWGIFVFEILRIYFIMPFPGSQKINSLDFAYFLHSYRWIFRSVFLALIIIGLKDVFAGKKIWPVLQLIFVGIIFYAGNFILTAEHIFHQVNHLTLKTASENKVNKKSLIIGIEYKGITKAYPIQFLEYHHQVQDSIAGKHFLITYCNVCRSGIVFEPYVDGRPEKFRLVGMDHFNAMFEDGSTKSWWRQSTGECVAGPLKGALLSDFPSQQMTLEKWLELHPSSLIMQADELNKSRYDTTLNFDYGKNKDGLTGTDSLSWNEKSWVIGMQIGNVDVAYDWNELKQKRIINDSLSSKRFFIALAEDKQSFVTFYRPGKTEFTIRHDTLFSEGIPYDFSGINLQNKEKRLRLIRSKQEFWHSWKQFHPNTLKK